MIIQESMYLSDQAGLDRAARLTELAADELEVIVGRFSKASHRHGVGTGLRGELIITLDGDAIIRHHFTKRVLWRLSPDQVPSR